jgi:hypothetical protein
VRIVFNNTVIFILLIEYINNFGEKKKNTECSLCTNFNNLKNMLISDIWLKIKKKNNKKEKIPDCESEKNIRDDLSKGEILVIIQFKWIIDLWKSKFHFDIRNTHFELTQQKGLAEFYQPETKCNV